MSEWLKSLTEKYGQMNKKKEKEAEDLDPVDKSELKGKHADRKDKDIDNDGDVDSSDKYLHKKRKAISKASDKDTEVKMNPKTEGKKLKEMRKGVKEAAAPGATATHKGEQDPQDKGLSPSAKKEKERKTPTPEYVDEPKVDAKNFTDFRKGLKASPKRSGDSNVGDK
jgi:hypothetical protein